MNQRRILEDLKRLVVQMKTRWRAGGEPDAVGAFSNHPSLKGNRSLMLDVALEEYSIRKERGQEVDVAQFCSRFPEIQKSLMRQIDVFNYLDEIPDLFDEIDWPDAGDTLFGKFVVCEELGRGAASRVYLCRNESLGQRQVVLKLTAGNSHEAAVQGRLNHPAIMPVFSVNRTDQFTAICMPFRGRSTLCDLLDSAWKNPGVPPTTTDSVLIAANRQALAWDECDVTSQRQMPLSVRTYTDCVREIAIELTAAIAHAHKHGVVHGDVKPSNVLLTTEGLPILLDFNLSRDLHQGGRCRGGTLPYMSPEQLHFLAGNESDQAINEKSDLFSLGVMLYELLTGRLPFLPIDERGKVLSAEQMLESQRKGVVVPHLWNRDVDRTISALVMQCLELKPEARPASASELLLALAIPRKSTQILTGNVDRPLRATTLAICAVLMFGVGLGIIAIYG
ncbi:MAG: serine/threonine-protein kinase [Planctomycetota bacterium]